jgi:protocatechuate 3,4-dioxygenase beta subunit
MDPSKVKIPPMKDLNIDNITENTIVINSQGPDERLKYVMSRLVTHLHEFAREVRLSTKEWMAALDFLVKVGQISSEVRHVSQWQSTLQNSMRTTTNSLTKEFILLSDILGLSLLVDAIDHPKPPKTTEGTVLGPFHTHEAELLSSGENISSDPAGIPCLVLCTVKDPQGHPIPGVKIDIWETDSTGHYDVQRPDHDSPDGRAVMESDEHGNFWFKAIRPVSYPIPHDGPVGQLLKKLHRHPWRPAHMHFMFEKKGWDHLITCVSPAPYSTPFLLPFPLVPVPPFSIPLSHPTSWKRLTYVAARSTSLPMHT